jgi:hypothetical protein
MVAVNLLDGVRFANDMGRFMDGGGCRPANHLRYPGPADAEVTGKCRPALDLARVEKRLIGPGKFQGIVAFGDGLDFNHLIGFRM